MNNLIVRKALLAAIFFTLVFTYKQTIAETKEPITKNKITKILSISSIVGQGEITFSKAKNLGQITVKVSGTTPVIDGKGCMFCVNTVKIERNLQVPLYPFFFEVDQKGNSVKLTGLSLTGPAKSEKTTEFILSGKNGATLQKEGNGFRLLKGEAYYLKTTK
jgi:hypothetical protein